MENNKIVQQLNALLIQTCDAEQGYQHSSGKCDPHSGIFDFLESQSLQRQSFARDITKVISMFGAKPDSRAFFGSTAHETWDRLRGLDGDRNAILIECQQGEQAAIEIYDGHLAKDNLPPVVRNLLVNQRAKIVRSKAQIDAQTESSPAPTGRPSASAMLNSGRISTLIHNPI